MVRSLLRFAAASFCLLSLLACLGIGWMWRRARAQGPAEYVQVACCHAYAEACNGADGLSVRVVRGWPGRPGVWTRTGVDDPMYADVHWRKSPAVRRDWLGATVETGQVPFYVGADGTPARLSISGWLRVAILEASLDGPPTPLRHSGLLPYWSASGVGHGWVRVGRRPCAPGVARGIGAPAVDPAPPLAFGTMPAVRV